MSEPTPIACTLSADALRQRLDEIATLGADSLIDHQATKEGHLLRFRDTPDTRPRLEQIIAAESACCPFLAIKLDQHDDELLLSIDAPGEGRAVADELASAFSATR